MKAKLTPKLCYIAGLQSKAREELSAVGVSTGMESIEQRFIEIAVNDLGIQPNRVVIEEIGGGMRHIFFYHSRVYRRVKEIVDNSDKIFRRRNELSASYVAGMFDAAGHVDKNGIYIKKIEPKDALVLQSLEIYTRGNRIMNMSSFVKFIKESSLLLEWMLVSKN